MKILPLLQGSEELLKAMHKKSIYHKGSIGDLVEVAIYGNKDMIKTLLDATAAALEKPVPSGWRDKFQAFVRSKIFLGEQEAKQESAQKRYSWYTKNLSNRVDDAIKQGEDLLQDFLDLALTLGEAQMLLGQVGKPMKSRRMVSWTKIFAHLEKFYTYRRLDRTHGKAKRTL